MCGRKENAPVDALIQKAHRINFCCQGAKGHIKFILYNYASDVLPFALFVLLYHLKLLGQLKRLIN